VLERRGYRPVTAHHHGASHGGHSGWSWVANQNLYFRENWN
jgi:hypothetical protein